MQRSIVSKKGRGIAMNVVPNGPPREASLQTKIEHLIVTRNADSLKELKDEMRGNALVMDHQFAGDGEPAVAIRAPPIYILLEDIKLNSVNMTGSISPMLSVMVNDWGVDPNAEFRVRETQGSETLEMTCTPMSWLMRQRQGWHINVVHLQLCIETLTALGADASLPFMVTPRDDYTRNGVSLVAIAIRLGSLRCVQALLNCGARFLPTDPAPMCAAMRIVTANDVIRLFHRNWVEARIVQDDLLKMDSSGTTALHIFINDPPQDTGLALELLDLMLNMGFSPSTSQRCGTTALAFAKECAPSSSTKKAIFECLNAHNRHMAVVAAQMLHSRPVPRDVMMQIWANLKFGGIRLDAAVEGAEFARMRHTRAPII
jgi:hypothetical protein